MNYFSVDYLIIYAFWAIILFLGIQAGLIDPAIFQRILMAKGGSQLRSQYLLLAAFDPAFRLVLMLIALGGLILFSTIEANDLIPYIIQTCLAAGFKGLAILSLLSVTVTTADSYLHAAGVTFAHDIVKPLYYNKPINELKWARYFNLLIAVIAVIISTKGNGIIDMVFIALEITAPTLVFPLLAGIMGIRSDKEAFYIALCVTALVFGISKPLLPDCQSHLSLLICIITNGLTFLGVHLLKNKKFVSSKGYN